MSELQVWKAIWQIRYPAAALLFDRRGQIAMRWHHKGDLSEWRIEPNLVRVHNKPQTVYLNADFRSITVVVEGLEAYERFERSALDFSFETLKTLEVRKLERIGLRLIQIEQRESFQKLCGNMRRSFYRLTEDEWKVIGGYPKDVGLHLASVDGDNQFNWSMGPMEREQLQGLFEAKDIKKSLPEVSLVADCDLYRDKPDIPEKSFEKELSRYFHSGIKRIIEMTHGFVDQFEGFK